MRRLSLIIFLIITFYFINISCAHNLVNAGLNLSVKNIKISSWLNLMPGGPGSFHISGEIKLQNNESYDINKISLVSITIKQHERQLYSFVPTFTTKVEKDNLAIIKEEVKEFSFQNPSGLCINKELEADLPINISLNFKDENDNYFYFDIENTKVEKVY